MPRATTQRFGNAQSAAAGPSKASSAAKEAGQGGNNPLFNTEKFGQHILKNPAVAQSIVDKANLKPTDVVLEVGPGTGNLTVRILEKAKKCVAVEMDPRMAAELKKRVLGKPEQRKLEIMVGDFVKAELPYFDVCISNTPYQISSPLVFKLLSTRPLPRTCVLMFQREFALRLCAPPGSPMWCRLSANVQLFSIVEHILKVGKSNFRPAPNVESSVVRITPKNPPPPVRFEEFDGLGRVVFSRRNKTIRASFGARGVSEMLEGNWKTWLAEREEMMPAGEFSAVLEGILVDTGFAEQRAAKMDIDDLLKILSAFNSKGIHFC